MKRKVLFVLIWLACLRVHAQQGNLPDPELVARKLRVVDSLNSLPPKPMGLSPLTSPDSDCRTAISVCQQTYTQTNSYPNYGFVQDLPNPSGCGGSNGLCLMAREQKTVWYTFTVQTSGTFGFIINTSYDYDFALYNVTGLPNLGCSQIQSGAIQPVRCNFSAQYGATGLTLPPSSTIPICSTASQGPLMPGLNVTAGQTYVLVVDNYTRDNTGYTITFNGTASIFDQTPPTVTSSPFNCTNPNVQTITLNFNEPILCSSINPANFTLTSNPGGWSIASVSGTGCGTGNSYTQQIVVTLNVGTSSGTVTLQAAGVKDKCNNTMAAYSTSFSPVAPFSITPSSAAICQGGSVTLNGPAMPPGYTYSWSNGATTQNINVSPTSTTTYTLTVTSPNGCQRSANATVNVVPPPVAVASPNAIQLCPSTTGTSTVTATIGGIPCTNCTFTWSHGLGTDANTSSSTRTNLTANVYTVTVSAPGCATTSSVNITVTDVSASGSTTCDVLYVTPNGTGNGLTPSNPTNIFTAISSVNCQATVIKMAVGTYEIDEPIVIKSYITLEGGYNSTFTEKTSSKAIPGTYPNSSTRIVRKNTKVDPGSPGYPMPAVGNSLNPRSSAIIVPAASTQFRLQDLRIECETFGAGRRVTNYGIYLGAGCSNYNIVRCYVDAGSGSPGMNGANGTGFTGTNTDRAADGLPGANADGPAPGPGGAGGGTPGAARSGGAGGTGGCFGCNGSNGVQGRDHLGNVQGTNGVNTSPSSSGAGGNFENFEKSCGGCDNHGGCTTNGCGPGNRGKDGVNGANGVDGADGSNGAPSSFNGGYFVVGGNGTDGSMVGVTAGHGGGGGGGGGGQNCGCQCLCFCNNNYGAGGGGGGQGGLPATSAGKGAIAGGGAFAIFAVSTGAGANIVDCELYATAGSGGTGGAKGLGQKGGFGGAGGAECDGGGGGNGGNGGRGGNSGKGGDAPAGQSCLACNLTGTTINPLTYTNLSLNSQPLLRVANYNCTQTNIHHTTTASSPTYNSFGSGVTTPTVPAAGASHNVQYGSNQFGRKTVTINAGPTNYPAQSFSSSSPVNIPDNSCTGATSTINVTGYMGPVWSGGISVTINNLTHTYVGDLVIFLIAPDGSRLCLFNRRGSYGNNLMNTTFADNHNTLISSGTAPFTGNFRQEQGLVNLNSCNISSTVYSFAQIGGGSIDPNGAWTLRVFDRASGDVGTLNQWTIHFPAYSHPNVAAQTFTNNTPVSIPDNNPIGATSTISVTGYPGAVIDASRIFVRVNINHTYDRDLGLFLVTPGGQIIGLSNRRGGSDDNYTNTVFGDAFVATNISGGTAPFSGAYRQEIAIFTVGSVTSTTTTFGSLGTINPNGNWSLRVIDVALNDVGTIQNWSITFPPYGVNTDYTYTDFNNITINPPSAGTISPVNPDICQGIQNFISSLNGLPGYTFTWSTTNLSGTGTATIANPTAGTTDITFTNSSTTTDYVVRVKLAVNSECCGTIATLQSDVTVKPTPAVAVASGGTICPGSTFTITPTPVSGINFKYYDNTMTTLLGSGPSYTTPVLTSTTSYKVVAENAFGCEAAPTTVTVTVTPTTPPTAIGAARCDNGILTLSVNPVPGADYYEWYDNSETTLLQQSSSLSFTTPFLTTTTTYKVRVKMPGCNPSAFVPVTATIGGIPSGLRTWNGSVSNDWFNSLNWTPNCVPSCSDDVLIPNGTPNSPDIAFNPIGAHCKNFTINAGASLSFDLNSRLEVCGDFTVASTANINMPQFSEVHFVGTTPQTITLNQNFDFYSVVINNTSGTYPQIILSNAGSQNMNISANGNLTFVSGMIRTQGTREVNIKNSASGAVLGHGINSYIHGNLRRAISGNQLYEFPVGHDHETNGGKGYQLATVNFTANTNVTEILSYFTPVQATSPLSVADCGANPYTAFLDNGYWTLDAIGGSTATYDITLYNRNYTNYPGGSAAVTNQKRVNSMSPWGLSGSCWTPSTPAMCRRLGVSNFSDFATSFSTTPFPVELLSLKATPKPETKSILVDWVTASEFNNAGFYLQRSTDAQNFSNIAWVNGNGTTQQQHTYAYDDYDVEFNQKYYYRLDQRDFNGASNLSQVVEAILFSMENIQIVVYPNPAQNFVNLDIVAQEDREFEWILFNSIGQEVMKSQTHLKPGTQTLQISLKGLANGTYQLQMKSGEFMKGTKIIKIQ